MEMEVAPGSWTNSNSSNSNNSNSNNSNSNNSNNRARHEMNLDLGFQVVVVVHGGLVMRFRGLPVIYRVLVALRSLQMVMEVVFLPML